MVCRVNCIVQCTPVLKTLCRMVESGIFPVTPTMTAIKICLMLCLLLDLDTTAERTVSEEEYDYVQSECMADITIQRLD